jgi:large subunit ribosomal protein L30
MAKKRINVKQTGSPIRRPKIQAAILRGLGLGKMNKIVNLEDTDSIRGMIKKIPHLVKII